MKRLHRSELPSPLAPGLSPSSFVLSPLTSRFWPISLVLCLLASCLSPPLVAQGVTAQVSGALGSPNRTQYGLGWLFRPLGPLEASLGGVLLTGSDGKRGGGQLEIDLWRRAPGHWYGVASIAGGVGSDGAENPWGGWSAGVGYRLLSLGSTDLGLEARYLHLWTPDDALTVGVRIAARFGGGSKPTTPPPASPARPPLAIPPLADSSADSSARSAARLQQDVVQTAIDAMGSPYLWGGTGANGFDCSGLIQFAYGRLGITLPRRSVDQAKSGRLIPRDLSQLEPGDILTFSASEGGPVSHVGMYIGERRFIHSASDGVRLSLLSPDDPNGKHWWTRWVGARRIVAE